MAKILTALGKFAIQVRKNKEKNLGGEFVACTVNIAKTIIFIVYFETAHMTLVPRLRADLHCFHPFTPELVARCQYRGV